MPPTNFSHVLIGTMLLLSFLGLTFAVAMWSWRLYRRRELWREKSGLKALFVSCNTEESVKELKALRRAGFNTIVTSSPPTVSTLENAKKAGLGVIAYISTASAKALSQDRQAYRLLRQITTAPNFMGFHYANEAGVEGRTSAFDQRYTYSLLKTMFPSALAITFLRVVLGKIDEKFLDECFCPEATDLVVPYFYPVGETALGDVKNEFLWETTLNSLLLPVYIRLQSWSLRWGIVRPVMPMLQGFEEPEYPVDDRFIARQMSVYTHLWPIRDVLVGGTDRIKNSRLLEQVTAALRFLR